MLFKKTLLATAVAFSCISGTVMADSWNLTQSTTVGSATTMSQGGTDNASVQAINEINGGAASVIENGSSQTVDTGTNTLTLNQNSTASTQAANTAVANQIGTNTGTFTQSTTGTGNITLNQLGNNNGNTQAINAAAATSDVTDLSQQVTTADIVTLDQNSAGNDNLQAGNTVSTAATAGATMTLVDQDLTPTTQLDMDQRNSGTNIQAGNNADAGTNAMGVVNQNISSPDLDMSQDTTDGTQIGNRAVAADVTNLDQTLTGDDIDIVQGGTAGVANGATQAGNALTTTGTVTAVDQTIGDAADDNITLDQNDGGSGVLQAGNLIDASNAGATITSGNQTITNGTGTLDMDQDDIDNSLQAGNALITGGVGGTVGQTVTVGALGMDQNNTSGSHQAANYAGARIQ